LSAIRGNLQLAHIVNDKKIRKNILYNLLPDNLRYKLLNWKLIGKHTCNFMKCCLLRFFSVDILGEENMNVTRQILIKMKS